MMLALLLYALALIGACWVGCKIGDWISYHL